MRDPAQYLRLPPAQAQRFERGRRRLDPLIEDEQAALPVRQKPDLQPPGFPFDHQRSARRRHIVTRGKQALLVSHPPPERLRQGISSRASEVFGEPLPCARGRPAYFAIRVKDHDTATRLLLALGE